MMNLIATSILNRERNELVYISFNKVISPYSRLLKVAHVPSEMILHKLETAVQ
jgi:hypothetical protein